MRLIWITLLAVSAAADEGCAVKVLDPDGKPIRNAVFSSRYDSERGGVAAPCKVKRLEDGSYRVAPADNQKVGLGKQGRYVLRVGAPKWGGKRVVWNPDSVEPVVIRMRRPASVAVTVRGAKPHLGYFGVVVQDAGVPDEQVGSGVAKSRDPVVRIRTVQPGPKELLLGVRLKSKHGGLFWTVARTGVALRSGANNVTLTMPKLHPLEVHGEAGRRFYITPAGQRAGVYLHYFELDGKGKFAFERLPAGKYHVHGTQDGKSTTIPFTIPAQQPLVLPANFR